MYCVFLYLFYICVYSVSANAFHILHSTIINKILSRIIYHLNRVLCRYYASNQLLLTNWLLVANLTVVCELFNPFFLRKILNQESIVNLGDANEATKRCAKWGKTIHVRWNYPIWNVREKMFNVLTIIFVLFSRTLNISSLTTIRTLGLFTNGVQNTTRRTDVRSPRYHSRVDTRAGG